LADFEYLAEEMFKVKLRRDSRFKMPKTFYRFVPRVSQ
jgi:hypothetical protein